MEGGPVTKMISVVVVDDNVVTREAVANLIRKRTGFDVSVASANVADAVGNVREANADAVLLEARHNHDSVRLTATLRYNQPDTRIIVTGMRPHQRDISDFVAAGASGFIMKDASLDECVESIRVVTDGGHALPRRLVGSLFEERNLPTSLRHRVG
jgi:two-component system invasion response regulator UvrY